MPTGLIKHHDDVLIVGDRGSEAVEEMLHRLGCWHRARRGQSRCRYPTTRIPSDRNKYFGGVWPGSLDTNRITRREEDARQQIESLLRAGGDDDIVGIRLHTTCDADMAGDGSAQ